MLTIVVYYLPVSVCFSLVVHKCRIKILARTVKGPASPRGSYILLTCDDIIRFVSGGASFASLLGLSFCIPRFRIEKKFSFAEKHKWSLIGSQLTPSTSSVATFDSFGRDFLLLLESREKIHSFSLNPPFLHSGKVCGTFYNVIHIGVVFHDFCSIRILLTSHLCCLAQGHRSDGCRGLISE